MKVLEGSLGLNRFDCRILLGLRSGHLGTRRDVGHHCMLLDSKSFHVPLYLQYLVLLLLHVVVGFMDQGVFSLTCNFSNVLGVPPFHGDRHASELSKMLNLVCRVSG